MSSNWDQPVQVTFRGVSLANEELSFKKASFVINPRSDIHRYWETFSSVCIFVTCLIVPFQASFNSEFATLWAFAYIFDVLFFLDVVLRFCVGYFSKGNLITDKSFIRKRYLRGKFLLDLPSIIPLDFLVFGVGKHLRWHHTLSLLRLNRVLRVNRLLSFFGSRENELGTNTSLIRAIKYATIGTITVHLMSCVWYSLACPNIGAADTSCDPNSWALKLNTGIELVGVWKKYVLSLYWATATATSTGYGDLHAVTEGEKWFSVCAMLVGIGLFFGFILGGMASMLTNLDSQRARYIHHLNVIKDHMNDMKISSSIRSRVMAYYEYLWTHNRGVSGVGMFDDLPLTFQAELSLMINKKVLEKAPLFKGLNPGFKRMLSLVIRPVFYMPNQIIASRGDIGHHMFYIHRGRAEVSWFYSHLMGQVLTNLAAIWELLETSFLAIYMHEERLRATRFPPDHLTSRSRKRALKNAFYIFFPKILCENDDEVLVTLKEGKLFGEVSMVYNLPRSASVRAATPCIIFLLDRADLNKVLKHYPEVAEQLYLAVEHRCDINNLQVGSDQNVYLDMENEEAEQWLRQNVVSMILCYLLWKLSHYVIKPESLFARMWERIVLVVLITICFVYTFVASFSISLHAIGYGETIGSQVLLVITYLLDVVLLADYLLRFNIASETTTELKEIRKSYKWSLFFWIDLLAILPIEVFAPSGTDFHNRWHYFAFLRLNRLIKAIRIPRFFTNLENSLSYSIGKVRALKFTIYIILITHISGCVWFLDACYGKECHDGSWAQHIGRSGTKAGLTDYIASLYWAAATMSSTGYGDIHAYNTESQLIATVVMLVGLLLYGYCLSSIAATLANSAAPKVEFFAKMAAVQQFMTEQNLSRSLMVRTQSYLSMLWRVHRGEAIPGGKRLIEDMPLTLQQDVTYEESKNVLERVPIFMETDAGFLRQLSLKTTSYLFSPGDYIVYAGDMGREMYCVRRGLVEVIGDDDITVVATLGPGAYFGEIGLIFGENRLATVKARTFCEILMLTKQDLDDVLANFPIVARQIYDAGINNEHLRDVRKAALESTKAAVRRLSVKCAQKSKSSRLSQKSKTSQKSQSFQESKKSKKKGGRVSPEMGTVPAGLMSVVQDLKEDTSKPYRELHPIAKVFSFLLMRRVILPDGLYFRVWQGVILVIAGILPFTLTLQAAFLHTSTALWIMNYCFDIICLVDMYIKFHLAFYNENNVLVTHPLYTARNYLRTNFSLDLLFSFPTDIIVLAIWPDNLGVLRILALARLNRCFYIYKVHQFFHFMADSIGKNTNLIGQLKFALYMAAFTHCIRTPTKDERTFPELLPSVRTVRLRRAEVGNRGLGNEAVGFQYVTSLYWAAATSASVGYGDIHAHTMTEMTFALFCMIIGIVFYGYIIASVAAGLANADAQRARYQERLDAIKSFLQEQGISENLTSRIVSYYEYLWLRNKGVDASSLFEGLPLSLQADISLSLYKDLIERVPLFEGTEIGFLKMLSMKVKPVYFLSKEYVVRKGDIGQEVR
ncbi:unnamed protein product, partial [Porites evermanni]